MKKSSFDPVFIEAFNNRLKAAIWLVLIVFGVLILRLWFLQILNGPAYRAKSENNRILLQDIPPVRGVILDHNGNVLVRNRPSYNLSVIPEDIFNQRELLEGLRRLIGLEPELAAHKLARSSSLSPFRPVCLKSDISRDELAIIETHRFNLPGVMIEVKPQRHYLYGHLASHLLGYVGEISRDELRSGRYPANKSGDVVGKSGLEQTWQSQLNGMRGGNQTEVDAAGRKLRVISRKAPIPGANVRLTIDRDLQELAENALLDKKGAIVALDPNDGRILAMASSPTFDPNLFVRRIEQTVWEEIVTSRDFPLQNRALSGQYPPGSVFKIIVALAGLEEGVIDPNEEIICHGIYPLGDNNFHCWKKYGHGKVALHRALRESCDVYFYKVGKRLGIDKIAAYAKRFGLGQRTGFSDKHEKKGLVPTKKWKLKRFGVPWQAGETISVSIGQSFLLVTPIQMANVISAVFNGGFLYRPQSTEWVMRPHTGDKISQFRPEIVGKTGIKEEYLALVRKALVGVVNEPHGTGWRAKLKSVCVAGKTGTAQVVTIEKQKEFKEETEIPSEFGDHAWFVAVAPAEKPQIAVSVLLENSGHGGAVSAPVAKEIIRGYLGVKD